MVSYLNVAQERLVELVILFFFNINLILMFKPYKNLMEKENGRRKLFFWAHIGPPTVPK